LNFILLYFLILLNLHEFRKSDFLLNCIFVWILQLLTKPKDSLPFYFGKTFIIFGFRRILLKKNLSCH